MRHAFAAGTIVAVLAGVVGYFVVLRQSSFAAHALSEIGFAGASGGVAFGFSAVYGLLGMSLVGAALIGALGKRLRGRDAVIGSVLAFSLGLGSYFLTRYKGNASGGFSLLFGEILGISVHDVWVIGLAGAIALGLVAALYRPLLFSSLDEDVAEATGSPCPCAVGRVLPDCRHRGDGRSAGRRRAADLQPPRHSRRDRRAALPDTRAGHSALRRLIAVVRVGRPRRHLLQQVPGRVRHYRRSPSSATSSCASSPSTDRPPTARRGRDHGEARHHRRHNSEPRIEPSSVAWARKL